MILAVIGMAIVILTYNSSNVSEYKLGKDTIKSINDVIGEVNVTSILTENRDGMLTKKIECKSNNAQEEVLKYTDYLINEESFELTSPIDMLNYSSIKLSKKSQDDGKTIKLLIHYGNSDYTIVIQKK